MHGVAEKIAQFLIGRLGEGITGHEEPGEDGTERASHPDPVAERQPRVGENLAELVLDVVVLGVVVLPVQFLESGLVPLVHEKDLALSQHLTDDAGRAAFPTPRG